MNTQITNRILMVRPCSFYFNVETSSNNYFQKNDHGTPALIQAQALEEFDLLVEKLIKNGIIVTVAQDTPVPSTPDSIFPNNWFISEPEGNLFLCPMFAENRREERKKFLGPLIDSIKDFNISLLNYTLKEKENEFLEGTGAIVIDRVNKVAFGSHSPRCDKELFYSFCKARGYEPIYFTSYQSVDGKRLPIYHTNVMMAIGVDFAVLCADSIDDPAERELVIDALLKCKKEIIYISQEQAAHFAGNVIQLKDSNENIYTVMSETAFNAFTPDQKNIIEKNSKIIYSNIPTIETYGGGSVRCMIAEIFE